MKQPPRGAIFEKVKMQRVEFLKGALERLENEVGIYYKLLEEKKQSDPSFVRGVGFWGSIRMLMPVVEAVSSVQNISPQELLGSLNIKTPYLVWDLFRHSLIHNDFLQHGKYQSYDVGWGVLMVGQGHIFHPSNIGIDVISLYKDLKYYLETEVLKNDQTEVLIEVGVIYQNPKQEIMDDFNKL